LNFIDLFAGCGGLSLGLSQAGLHGLFAIEKNPDAFKTFNHNLNGDGPFQFNWPQWLPVEAISTSDLLINYNSELQNLRGQVDLIAGGPPCQGFSFAGRRNVDDPRNQLKDEYLKIVDIIQPKFLLFENVKGFTTSFKNSENPSHSDQIIKQLQALTWGGYHVATKMLNASLFGVPQPRARFILMAIRRDVWLRNEKFSPLNEIEKFAMGFKSKRGLGKDNTSAKEAISDLEIEQYGVIDSCDTRGFQQINYDATSFKTSFQKLMRKDTKRLFRPNSLRLARHRPDTIAKFNEILNTCPKGRSLPKEFREKHSIKKQCFTPLHPDQPSKTVTTLPDDLLHYNEPRILTVRECARLQTFPDWFDFLGKYTTGGARRRFECPRYTQVGNAVPPLMAEALGQILIRELMTANE